MFYSGSRSKLGKPTVQDGSFSGQNLPQPTAEYNAAYPQTVTLVDGAISQLNDFNGNGNNATQSTAANRPVLSRADNLENTFAYSEEFDNAYWDKTTGATSILANQVANPLNGAVTADKLRSTAVVSSHYMRRAIPYGVGTRVRCSWYAQAAEETVIKIQYSLLGGTVFNLSTGSVTSNDAGLVGSISSNLGSGWYRCTIEFTINTAGGTIQLYLRDASSYDGTPLGGVYIFGASIQVATASSEYLATTTFPQYAGINGNAVPVLDGSNDSLATTIAVNPTGGMWGAVFCRSTNAATNGRLLAAFPGTASDRMALSITSAGSIQFYVQNGVTNYIGRTAPNGTVTANQSCVISFTYDGGTASSGLKIYKDGVQVDTADSNAGVYAVPTAGANLTIGSRSAIDGYFNGYLSPAVFGQGSTWADADRQATERDLMTKYIPNYVWFNPANNVTSDAGAVASWTDVTNTYVASQSTAANRPAVSTLNGQVAFLFDGTNDSLATSLAANPTGGMAGVVVVRASVIAGSTRVILAAFGSTAAQRRFEFYITTGGAVYLQIFDASGNFIGRNSANSSVSISDSTVLSFTYSGSTANSNIKLYKDGVQIDTTDAGSGAYAVPTVGTTLTIGADANGGGSSFFNGYIADAFFVQGRQMSDSERQGWESRFMTQYGIS